ncbi:IS91 family transposase [Thiocystis violacea]|uniref:IS91 family transposase n=1 Tax=Thiocystis violacea TaxID=13725 RepID=UPI00190526BC|nr:IS91 family transposase [Thiocystis violacea]
MEATLQNIFRDGFKSYHENHGLSADQTRAAQAIMLCQSEALGYEEWICLNDGHTEQQNHSCRHRSCPRCHGALTHDWLERTQARLLPCDHYHVVFTLPHDLNALWQYNREWCSDHLFKASAETLKELLSDEKYLGAEVGLLSALHTWGRTLSIHPHVHVLVTGGGLDRDGAWRTVKNDYLLPVAVIKAKFRGKWLTWLNDAYAAGDLTLPPDWTPERWTQVLRTIARKDWNVRIQGGYRHGYGVANYLSRYLRGGPIKDHRIVSATSDRVTFCYRDHHDNIEKTLALSQTQFIDRVLWHVPVKGQHHVRYYGLYAAGAATKRQQVRDHLGVVEETTLPAEPRVRECPTCGRALFHRVSVRGQISYLRNTVRSKARSDVQPGAQADPINLGAASRNLGAVFFALPGAA